MRHRRVSGERRVLGPPIQIPRVQDAARGIDCKSGTTEDSAQYDFESIVVEIAQDNVTQRKFHRPRKGFHLLPMIGTDKIFRTGSQKVAGIWTQSQVRRVQSEKFAGLLTLHGGDVPAVAG